MGKQIEVGASVLLMVTTDLPTIHDTSVNWKHLSGLELADSDYRTPGQVNILLGGSL